MDADPFQPAHKGLRSILAAGALAVAAAVAPAQDIDLSNIDNGTGGFVINGQAADDRSGRSVSAAGDVNGDGLADLIIGADASDPAAGVSAGRSYVVFGKTGGAAVDLSAVATGTSTLGFVINGQAGADRSGCSVSSAGDVNGDGLADVIVGARDSAPAWVTTAGRSYVVFGKSDGADVELSAIDGTGPGGGAGGFVINGQADNDRSGISVSSAGDVNGDGLADVIVGAYRSDPAAILGAGRSYVVFGKTGGADVDLSAIDDGTGGFVINGQARDDRSGSSVSSAGDVNGDGMADVIVGAPYGDSAAGANAGRSYIVFGKTDGADADLSAIDGTGPGGGTGGFVISGQTAGELSGVSVSSAGDVNGDGLADVVVGARVSAPGAGILAGRSYVVFGKTDCADVDLSAIDGTGPGGGTGGFVINGQTTGDFSGTSVSSAGDVNGDGLADLIVGAPTSGPAAGFSAGRSYVVFGKAGGAEVDLSAIDNGIGGFVINGQAANDRSGNSVSTAGDVNGDGLADVIVGAYLSDPATGGPGDNRAGRSYVVFSLLTPAASGTYRGVVAAGDADRAGIGTSRFGDDRTIFPDSRSWVDFDAGSGPDLNGSSLVTTTLTRSKSGVTGWSSPVASTVANVVWTLTTNRTGWSNARVTFQYTNAEIAGIPSLNEANLRLYRKATPASPWVEVPNVTVDVARNQISGDTASFSDFIIAQSNVLAVDLTAFSASATSASSPVAITWTTAAEFDTAGFHVESAASANGPWSRVTSTLIPAEGSATSGAIYTIVDQSPITSGERWYRLSETVLDGATITYEPAKATVGAAASSVGAWTMY